MNQISFGDVLDFPFEYDFILKRIEEVDVLSYGKNRNFLNGAVSYLSPYISRGVLSGLQVVKSIRKKFTKQQAEKFLQQLAWREYFQRVWQSKENNILSDLKQSQSNVYHHNIPTALVQASTDIDVIDHCIFRLHETGYMHNHARMYTAMLACNIAQSHWLLPAKWMYYHLLDGDVASNMLSWQWVAGTFSNKKYYANQENINKYSGTVQKESYLNIPYDSFQQLPVPDVLRPTINLSLSTPLPTTQMLHISESPKTFIYNSYNLDPLWHKNETGNRVLLLEPSHFEKFPVSQRVINFIIRLAKTNIPNLNIFVGEFAYLQKEIPNTSFCYKEHPTAKHYKGIMNEREWLFPEVYGDFKSFFAYWKKCEKYL